VEHAVQSERAGAGTSLRHRIDRVAYRAQQWSIQFPITTARRVALALTPRQHPPDAAAVAAVWRRYDDLLERDLQNVEAGLYPRALLFQIPLRSYASVLPGLVRDIPRVVRRALRRDHRDLPASVDLDRYPPYYRRNFHWQTDGYFSRRSAALYDLSTELLFLGTTDVMRRQVIPPISRFLAHGGPRDGRVLDVACGTGRTLAQIAVAHPELKLYGVDLSPYYVQAARNVLHGVADVSLVVENAERLPFRHGYFDVLTSVYLFHELPRPARRRVLAEMYRVLRPGGLVVLEDSAQLAESGELAFFLARFSADFHEPFYRDYVGDDLGAAVAEAGFDVESVEPQFVSKVLVARKPAGARGPTAPHGNGRQKRRA
jgi:ubiquinone/menaquinone biosynthesis C-methylase UbiE